MNSLLCVISPYKIYKYDEIKNFFFHYFSTRMVEIYTPNSNGTNFISWNNFSKVLDLCKEKINIMNELKRFGVQGKIIMIGPLKEEEYDEIIRENIPIYILPIENGIITKKVPEQFICKHFLPKEFLKKDMTKIINEEIERRKRKRDEKQEILSYYSFYFNPTKKEEMKYTFIDCIWSSVLGKTVVIQGLHAVKDKDNFVETSSNRILQFDGEIYLPYVNQKPKCSKICNLQELFLHTNSRWKTIYMEKKKVFIWDKDNNELFYEG